MADHSLVKRNKHIKAIRIRKLQSNAKNVTYITMPYFDNTSTSYTNFF